MLDGPSSELLWLALAVIAAGLCTGVLAGLFGVGGGAVIVPALYEVFRVLIVWSRATQPLVGWMWLRSKPARQPQSL